MRFYALFKLGMKTNVQFIYSRDFDMAYRTIDHQVLSWCPAACVEARVLFKNLSFLMQEAKYL